MNEPTSAISESDQGATRSSLFGPPDQFGVPPNYFGRIEPDFCEGLARVVMLAALLEDRLWTLLTQLKTPAIEVMIFEGPDTNVVYQSTYAGRTAQALIDPIRIAVAALPSDRKHHIAAAISLMDDAERAFRERNNFVHSVWSRPTLDNGYGHRGINVANRGRLRKADHEFQHGFVVTRETFSDVVALLVDVYERVRQFEDAVRIPSGVPPTAPT